MNNVTCYIFFNYKIEEETAVKDTSIRLFIYHNLSTMFLLFYLVYSILVEL